MTSRILVKGKVQGVFYRASTQAEAKKLGLKGFVQNSDDGNVLIEVDGEEDKIKSLISWCWNGPPASVVHSVTMEEIKFKDFPDFRIK